ncbi:hypothetical protein R3P38DRAFT_3059603 [Favolaschia claudopus]
MHVANGLCGSARRYNEEKVEIDRANYRVIDNLATGLGFDFNRFVTRSPTLAREVNLFSRDLEILDVDAWHRIRPVVMNELKQRASLDGDCLTCPFCSSMRLFHEEGLHSHITQFHPKHSAEHVEVPGHYRCSLCRVPRERSRIFFDQKSLVRHIHARH